MAEALTPAQADVVAKLREHGVPLVRWPGGFWTYEGCPADAAKTDAAIRDGINGIPTWWTTIGTVRAMERKGVLVRSGHRPREWDDPRVLVEGWGR